MPLLPGVALLPLSEVGVTAFFDCDALYDGCCTTLHRPAVPQDGAVPPLPSAAVPLLLGSGYR